MDEVLQTFSLDKHFLLWKCKAEYMLTCLMALELSVSFAIKYCFKTEKVANSLLVSLSFGKCIEFKISFIDYQGTKLRYQRSDILHALQKHEKS